MRNNISDLRIILTAFVAGFYAVLCFHQIGMGLLYWIGIFPMAPFNMQPTHPFGIPTVISASIWGGFWGILFAFLFFNRYRGIAYWLISIIAGAVLLSLIAGAIVAPLKGKGFMWGMNTGIMAFALFVNACWGFGTAWFYKLMNAR